MLRSEFVLFVFLDSVVVVGFGDLRFAMCVDCRGGGGGGGGDPSGYVMSHRLLLALATSLYSEAPLLACVSSRLERGLPLLSIVPADETLDAAVSTGQKDRTLLSCHCDASDPEPDRGWIMALCGMRPLSSAKRTGPGVPLLFSLKRERRRREGRDNTALYRLNTVNELLA